MLTVSPIIANTQLASRCALPRCAAGAPRSFLATVCNLLYARGRAADYHNSHAGIAAGRSPCLDFQASHVYPEACHSEPQVDRDAVIVFLGD